MGSRGTRRDPLLLGIDLGTSSVKVLATDLDGHVHGRGQGEYAVSRPGPGRAEQSPADWWTAVRRAVSDALRQAGNGGAARRVVAVGLDGQMHGTVLVGADGAPLGNAVIWPDQRSAVEVAELTDRVGPAEVLAAVGGPLATGFQAPTVRWLRMHEPARLDAASAVLLPKDWLRLSLTGVLGSDPSDGSGTGFLDTRTRAWWPPMSRAVGLDPDRLPPLRNATEPAGTLLPDAAAELGLPAGIPVATGAGDTPAGLMGAGLVTPDAFLVTISTGGQVAVPASVPSTDRLGRSHTFCGALPPGGAAAGWYRMAGILSAGSALRWFRHEVLGPGAADHDRLSEWAASVPPGADGLLFLPYLAGERSPLMDPEARGAFVGLTGRHGRAELVRAVMEGVTLACLDATLCLAEAGPLPATLVLGGGGARSAVWAGIVADVFGRPVRRLATEEQAAIGACILAGAAAGRADALEAARRWSAWQPAIEPDAGRHERYEALFELFRASHRATAAIEHRLGRLERAGEGPNGPSEDPVGPVPSAPSP